MIFLDYEKISFYFGPSAFSGTLWVAPYRCLVSLEFYRDSSGSSGTFARRVFDSVGFIDHTFYSSSFGGINSPVLMRANDQVVGSMTTFNTVVLNILRLPEV